MPFLPSDYSSRRADCLTNQIVQVCYLCEKRMRSAIIDLLFFWNIDSPASSFTGCSCRRLLSACPNTSFGCSPADSLYSGRQSRRSVLKLLRLDFVHNQVHSTFPYGVNTVRNKGIFWPASYSSLPFEKSPNPHVGCRLQKMGAAVLRNALPL
jgi:hypothetical protein